MAPKPYSEIEPLQTEWLWPGRIPFQDVTLIAGDGGIGKGMLLSDLVSRVTRGAAMPDGTSSDMPGPGSVILVTSEDDPHRSTAWRLRAAGADMARVYDKTQDFVIPGSLASLRADIAELGDVRLVVIDPLSAVSSIALTSSNVRVRRTVMNPLESLARDTGVSVVVVHHTVKSGRVAGTKGITDAARMVLRVSKAVQDEKIRLIHVDKTNIASDSAADVAYTVAGKFPDVRVHYLSVPESDVQTVPEPSTPDKVLALLSASDEPLEARQIAERIGGDYTSVRVALTRLKARSAVLQPERGQWAAVKADSAPTLRVAA